MSLARSLTLLAAAGLLTLGACSRATGGGSPGASSGGSPAGPSTASSASAGVISVTANDSECTLSATSAPAGTTTFQVTNTGSKVTEFYVYDGDRVVGEAENITPGLSRTLSVQVSQPGTLTTACKPGMVGDGITGTFTVTAAGS